MSNRPSHLTRDDRDFLAAVSGNSRLTVAAFDDECSNYADVVERIDGVRPAPPARPADDGPASAWEEGRRAVRSATRAVERGVESRNRAWARALIASR
jgi:hypothetical protein